MYKLSRRRNLIVAGTILVFMCACTKKENSATKDGLELQAPQQVQIETLSTSAQLSWSAVEGAYGYLVEVAKGASFTNPFYKSDTLFAIKTEITGLEAKTGYVARIKAIHKDNPSLTSKGLLQQFTTTEAEVPEEALAFPGAEGFGKMVTGGRGGRVIKVTNLNDAGAGSLRDAVNASGPRIIVFEVSGTIQLKSLLNVRNKDITIAGQTAPGDGICIRDYPVSISGENVIIRFMRFRMGDAAQQEGDALGSFENKNMIIDHCSISWSTDECASFYQNDNFTMQWCLISQSLRNSVHGKGAHGYGGIWGGKNASFHHNLMAHHDSRNPRFGEREGQAYALTDLTDVRNNVFYNWGGNSAYGGEAMNINIVNNYYKAGPATKNAERIYSPDKYMKNTESPIYNKWGKFYITGNFVEGSIRTSDDNWTYGVYNQFHSSYGTVSDADKAAMRMAAEHPVQNNVVTYTPSKAYAQVLAYVGASLKRDALDATIISDVTNKTATAQGSNGSTNGIIDTQADAGGWPVLNLLTARPDTDGDGMPDTWEVANKLNPQAANANGKDLSTVYDNIEVYINSLVGAITTNQKL
ncbi:pectate lyase [Niabella yanshanensis]|uniref:Pectate lyase n=1 Tax=Niabella yanshanensis TaxID=577386 RepID=A0ABZ0W0Z2_9BACT|nr:pectate lyase [Niabella yanshanensis]WQD36394.1 pectate lyase [Niabella yanshanensis]